MERKRGLVESMFCYVAGFVAHPTVLPNALDVHIMITLKRQSSCSCRTYLDTLYSQPRESTRKLNNMILGLESEQPKNSFHKSYVILAELRPLDNRNSSGCTIMNDFVLPRKYISSR